MRRDILRTSVQLLGHGLAVSLVAALMAYPYFNEASLSILASALEFGAWSDPIWIDLGIHLGLAACLWGLLYIGYCYARLHLEENREPTLVSAQGSVMLETLIVFPVFLLLSFGMAQLSINNIASLVTELATMEAGRSAWVWDHVECPGDGCNADRRARIQAAAVLTPVVPSVRTSSQSQLPLEARRMRGVLVGTQIPRLSSRAGRDGMKIARNIRNRFSSSQETSFSFAGALGTRPFIERTTHRFTFAYHAISVDVSREPPAGNDSTGQITVDLTYNHLNAFPMFGYIFGDQKTIAQHPGYYTEIERQYTQKRLPPPNVRLPE